MLTIVSDCHCIQKSEQYPDHTCKVTQETLGPCGRYKHRVWCCDVHQCKSIIRLRYISMNVLSSFKYTYICRSRYWTPWIDRGNYIYKPSFLFQYVFSHHLSRQKYIQHTVSCSVYRNQVINNANYFSDTMLARQTINYTFSKYIHPLTQHVILPANEYVYFKSCAFIYCERIYAFKMGKNSLFKYCYFHWLCLDVTQIDVIEGRQLV